MLTNFALKHATDILLLQEATTEDVYNIVGYTVHLNFGDIGQATAILAEEGISITRITRLPSDRGAAAAYESFGFVNLYVPLGPLKGRHMKTSLVWACHTHSDLFRPT
jgi:hypothetical protein